MFTLDQIKAAHSKVKSGADFPAYIREIKQFGVGHYETFVTDGRTNYSGKNDFKVSAPPRYDALAIASVSNADQFKTDLKAHQQGKSDFPTFCRQAASLGIEKWIVDLTKMTCTYFDLHGNEVLTEQIPQ
ncbi:MAG TPA: DUF1398 domain-containing protein [Cyclobacteriaceae bacterium]|nr:DUF1398 domain-containing protein [Cyclobacteriaceae bacterium]